MAITEEHFQGFDPELGYEEIDECPRYTIPGAVVWFEEWFFTAWTFGLTSDTGISYNHSFRAFDSLGNIVRRPGDVGLGSCGFTGNTTCRGFSVCPTNDEWLAKARAACQSYGLPPAGTVQLLSSFTAILGNGTR